MSWQKMDILINFPSHNMKKMILLASLCIFSILFTMMIDSKEIQQIFVENKLLTCYNFQTLERNCDITEADSTMVPFLTGELIEKNEGFHQIFVTFVLLMPLSFAIIFLLFLFTRYHVSSKLEKYVYENPKTFLEKTYSHQENIVKDGLGFILLSTLVSMLFVFMILNVTGSAALERMLDFIGTFDLSGVLSGSIEDLIDNQDENQASETVISSLKIFGWMVFTFGAIWIFALRNLKTSRERKAVAEKAVAEKAVAEKAVAEKVIGSRVLLIFIYSSIVILIFLQFLRDDPIFDFGLYGISVEEDFAVFVFAVAIIVSSMASFFFWTMDRFVFKRCI